MSDPSWLYSNDKVAKYGTEVTSLIRYPVIMLNARGAYQHCLTADPTIYSAGTSYTALSGAETSTDIGTGVSYAFALGSTTGTLDFVATDGDPLLQNITIPKGSLVVARLQVDTGYDAGATLTGNYRLSYVSPGGSIVDIVPMTTNNPLSFNSTSTGWSSSGNYATAMDFRKVSSQVIVPSGSRFRWEFKVVVTNTESGYVNIQMGNNGYNGGGCWFRIPIQPLQ